MDNEQIVLQIQTGEDVSGNMLILWQKNKAFIAQIARRFRGSEDVEDLEQEGYIGLFQAVNAYNCKQGIPFINYAAFWIRQAMQRYVENNGSVVRIPCSTRQQVKRYEKLLTSFWRETGRKPTDTETRALMCISKEKLERLKEVAVKGKIGSLDAPIACADDDNLTVGDMIADPWDAYSDMLEQIRNDELAAVLWPMVDALPGKQGEIIREKYQDGKTLKEMAATNGVTPEAVRQWERKASCIL